MKGEHDMTEARRDLIAAGLLSMAVCLSGGQASLAETVSGAGCRSGDVIVFTANQSWLSRIYVLSTDGAVLDYFEYEYFIFSDVEIVDNELYVTDWVAPRLYKVDLSTGALDVIVDDWNLLSMYDVACDGEYFYIDEWSLNRYTLEGDFAGSTSFSESVRGGAWDGSYYWTLTTDDMIRCWDISAWPTVVPVPTNDFAPPSSLCRGLWYDGAFFWSAEQIDGSLGFIYRFDHSGTVAEQWLAPAFQGYAAGVIRDFIANSPPDPPAAPAGHSFAYAGVACSFRTSTSDPDGDPVWYQWDWGDEIGPWIGPYASGELVSAAHTWEAPGDRQVRVRSVDDPDGDGDPADGLESAWSSPAAVDVRILGDVNGDGVVSVQDFLMQLAQWGTTGPEGDLNSDGTVDVSDFLILLASWTT
jgi:hypothetical protein